MKNRTSANPIEIFFKELNGIGKKHEELADTDVREALHIVLNHYFVWNKNGSDYPVTYGMFTSKGDKLVSECVNRFIDAVKHDAEISRIRVGQERLNLLQNKCMSPDGIHYDEFIGHSDRPLPPTPLPKYLFEDGDYD